MKLVSPLNLEAAIGHNQRVQHMSSLQHTQRQGEPASAASSRSMKLSIHNIQPFMESMTSRRGWTFFSS